MLLTDESSSSISVRKQELKPLLDRILASVKVKPGAVLKKNSNLYRELPSQSFYIVKDGGLKFEQNGKVLFYFEAGDLVGLERDVLSKVPSASADFQVNLDEISADSLCAATQADPEFLKLWNSYISSYISLLLEIISNTGLQESSADLDLREFNEGDWVIKENTSGNEVFTLISGRAEVFVDGARVGEVLPDEIFGAIAAMTGTKRTASVRVTEPSSVLVLPKEDFVRLLQTRPNALQKTFENMARLIMDLNHQVADFHAGRQAL
jgi:CRP/FNR family cyclic AMP-dependent transcriptional regulator